jgi:ADP-ribose pyrophosphatase YjhB (NUDIX family)
LCGAPAAAAILVTPQGILLTKRAHEPKAGMLDVPGGFVNYNESIETALARELHEELSIKVTNYQYIGSFPNIYVYKDITYFTTDAFFICIYDNRLQPVPNEEIEEIVYVDPGSIPFDLLAFDSAKAAFKLNISQLLKELI